MICRLLKSVSSTKYQSPAKRAARVISISNPSQRSGSGSRSPSLIHFLLGRYIEKRLSEYSYLPVHRSQEKDSLSRRAISSILVRTVAWKFEVFHQIVISTSMESPTPGPIQSQKSEPTNRRSKTIFQLDSPYTAASWSVQTCSFLSFVKKLSCHRPEIAPRDQDAILELLCR